MCGDGFCDGCRSLNKELRYYIDINGHNDPFQSAYRPKHSTETALVRTHEDLMQAVDSRRGVLLVLLDLSAAFDTLHHSTPASSSCNRTKPDSPRLVHVILSWPHKLN